jgi:ABC-type Fe3+ transport system permease subunit
MFSALTFSIYSSVKKSDNPTLATTLAYIYFVLTLFAGAWGYFTYTKRLTLIKLRDGKHLDAPLGPLIVSLGVLGAIIINFIVGFRSASKRVELAQLEELHPLIRYVNERMFRLVGAEGY